MKIRDFKNKLNDENQSVNTLLLLSRNFFELSKDKSYVKWIEDELNGYELKSEVPKYRMFKNDTIICKLFGMISGSAPVPVSNLKGESDLENEFIDMISNIKIIDSIGKIESYIEEPRIFQPTQGFRYIFNREFHGANVTSFHFTIDKGIFKNILTNIRIKLQEFVNQLDTTNEIDTKEENKKPRKIVNKTKNNYSFKDNDAVSIGEIVSISGGDYINSENIIRKSIDIVKNIKPTDENELKLITTILEKLEEHKDNKNIEKKDLLNSLNTVIMPFLANTSTALPLLTPLFTFLGLK